MAGTWKKDPTSWRTTPRPRGWKTTLVPKIKARDQGQCTWIESEPDGGHWTMKGHPDQCPNPGRDVDHIGPPDNHHIDNLRLLCAQHHKVRSAKQAVEARTPRPPRTRTPAPHPGRTIPHHNRQ